MLILGLALLGLTLYTSTLAFALRDYWRSELSERLAGSGPRRWLDWLEEHESELQLLTDFVRITLMLGVFICAIAGYGTAAIHAGQWAGILVPTIAAVVLLLAFGVGLPHGLARHAGEAVLSHSLWVLFSLWTVLWPITQALIGIDFFIRRLLGKAEPTEHEESALMEQEILAAVSEGEAAGAVDEDQKEIIKSVFRLGDTAVSAVMTPRTDIDAIAVEATYDEACDLIVRTGHSRIPVYEQTVDHIVGVLYAKDLLRVDTDKPFDVRRLMRIAPYVPESKSVDDLLDDFRRTKVQIAIVLDEYGGTAGLVTIEDILEELVGEIADEYDQEPTPTIARVDENTLDVDARVRVDEINEELGVSLPDESDYETIGGFVFSTLGKIPAVGDEFQHENIRFSVLAAEPRKIIRLRIHVQREKVETP